MKKYFALFLATVLVTTMVLQGTSAATGIDYNNIIDDMTFDQANTMTASQIDAFLNTFPDSCISTTNGFSAPDVTGYSPTKSFQYGNLASAGAIIYHASQAYGINPQVILTTLQKEQGLVKGDGANIVRSGPDNKNCGALAISASMGYNCPDSVHLTSYSGFTLYAYRGTPITSVTNTCVGKAAYVGFSRQVIIAAWQMTFDRHRSEGQNNWYINKPNWDNSDDLGFCYSQRTIAGGPFYLCPDQDSHATDPYVKHSGQYVIDTITVTIENGATAALYNYTPHLHGQDLFTAIFTGWFGLPHSNDTLTAHPNNTLISSGGTVYLIQNGIRQPITALAFGAYGYIWSQIKPATSGDVALPVGATIATVPSGTLFTSGEGSVYIVHYSGGTLQKQWISAAAFGKLGYKWSQILKLPSSAAPSDITPGYYDATRHPAGTLVAMNNGVYLLDQTSSHYISLLVFNSNHYSWNSVVPATTGDTALPEGPPSPIRDGTMLLLAGDGVYLIETDASGVMKRPVGPWECYANRLHYTSADWITVSASSLPARTGSRYTC